MVVPRKPNAKFILACFPLLLAAGCLWSKPESNGAADESLSGVTLQLLVVGDPELAAAAGQLQDEWNARTESNYQVKSISEEELTDAKVLAADAVICPSYQLGPLAQRNLLAEVPEKLSPDRILEDGKLPEKRDDNWSGVIELLKVREALWGGKRYAVPFGSPVLTCYYRADLLRGLGRLPPQSWAEYQELAELLGELLGDRDKLGQTARIDAASWSGTVEPLAPGWAGLVLLARAAPYAKHRDNYSTLFSIETMEPLVAGAAFVRALEELVAAAKLNSSDPFQYDPTAARTAFWRGQCGMALCWPTAAKGGLPETPVENVENIEVGFAELPGSKKVYEVGDPEPKARADEEDPHVPLLAVTGRIGVVTGKSKHPEAAFRLLLWLSGDEFSPRVSALSPATTLFRQSHLKAPQRWVEEPISPAAAAQYAAVTETTLSRQQWLFALRIPGRPEYLGALDEAVWRAVRGEQTPAESLQQAATRWREITRRLGADRQKAAYRHSVKFD